MDSQMIEGVAQIIGYISSAFFVFATITPSKKVGKVATKMEEIGSMMNIVGFDLKAVLGLFKKKKS